jgi:Flp pilus assembly protein CpaB
MAAGNKKTGRIFIILAIVLVVILGVVAFVFKDQFFPPVQSSALPTPVRSDMKEVLVLTTAIPLGGEIKDAMIAPIKIPAENFIEGLYFSTAKEVVGRRAKYPLQAGVILTTGMVASGEVGSFASSQIPNGYVAISIPISRLTSVSYALQPGDHVSVIVSMLVADLDPTFETKLPNFLGSVTAPGTVGTQTGTSNLLTVKIEGSTLYLGRTEFDKTLDKAVYVLPSEAQRPRIVSQMLISDAQILGVGKMGGFQQEKQVAAAAAAGQPTPTPVPGAEVTTDPTEVTLIVTPQDAVTINYLLLAGGPNGAGIRLNLVLRSAGDTQPVKTESVTLQFIMDQYTIPLPSKMPYGIEPRIDSLRYPETNIVVIPAAK